MLLILKGIETGITNKMYKLMVISTIVGEEIKIDMDICMNDKLILVFNLFENVLNDTVLFNSLHIEF